MSKINRPEPLPTVEITSDDMLTPPEVARLLRVSSRTVYRLIQAEALPSIRVGKRFFVLRGELNRWVAAGGSRS